MGGILNPKYYILNKFKIWNLKFQENGVGEDIAETIGTGRDVKPQNA